MAQVLRRRGRIQLKLDSREREALAGIVERMQPLLAAGPESSLRAYDEGAMQREYDRWVRPEVELSREADMAVVRDGLSAGEDTLPLTEAQALAWLRAFNHLRLAAGQVLGIDSDGWEERADAKTKRTTEYGVLIALGWIQEELVAALES